MIRVVSIRLHRAEGPIRECGPPRLLVGGRLFERAHSTLWRWGRTAPEKGRGYDKTDFRVTWADGEEYIGRWDLERDVYPNLPAQMLGMFQWVIEHPEYLETRELPSAEAIRRFLWGRELPGKLREPILRTT